jgi:hypothetical protein
MAPFVTLLLDSVRNLEPKLPRPVVTCAEVAKDARAMAAATRVLVVFTVRGSCDERWFMKVAAAGAVAMD